MLNRLDQKRAEMRLEREHSNGIYIAEKHLTPFLQNITKKHQYTRLEVASALLIIAYNVLRKERNETTAKRMFRLLSQKSQDHIEVCEKKKTRVIN